jgi:hypothetical protein
MIGTDWANLASVISAVILVGGLIVAAIKYQRNNTRPFHMRVSLDPYEKSPNIQLTNELDLNFGDNRILVFVTPRVGTSLDKVNMRFVNRKFSPGWGHLWGYVDGDPNSIQITEFEDILYKEKGEEWGRSYFESESDNVGGFYGYYSPALPVKAGQLVSYYVYVRVNYIWKGYLSYEGSLEQRRSWRRIKARVRNVQKKNR